MALGLCPFRAGLDENTRAAIVEARLSRLFGAADGVDAPGAGRGLVPQSPP